MVLIPTLRLTYIVIAIINEVGHNKIEMFCEFLTIHVGLVFISCFVMFCLVPFLVFQSGILVKKRELVALLQLYSYCRVGVSYTRWHELVCGLQSRHFLVILTNVLVL